MPTMDDLLNTEANPQAYKDKVVVTNFDDAKYDYKFQLGNGDGTTWDALDNTLASDEIELNNLGPVNVRAKVGNFLPSDLLTKAYEIKLPGFNSATYHDSNDTLAFEYGYDELLTGAVIEYSSDDKSGSVNYSSKSFVIDNLKVSKTKPLTLVLTKAGWVDSVEFTTVSYNEGSLGNTITNPDYFTTSVELNGVAQDNMNIVLTEDAVFNFKLTSDKNVVVAAATANMQVLVDGVKLETATVAIETLHDASIVIKFTDTVGKTYINNLKLQKDKSVGTFNVTFNYVG